MLDGAGYPVAPGGITACPGLYFTGLDWMTWRKSGIIYGVGDDARGVAADIERRLRSQPVQYGIGARMVG